MQTREGDRTARGSSRLASVVAFGLGMALVAGVGLFLSWGLHRHEAVELQEGRALMVARLLAEAAQRVELRDRAALSALVASVQREVGGLREAFVLKGNQYVVHSDAALGGKRLSRDSAEDKLLFDKGRRLQTAYSDNVKILATRPELGKVAAEQEVDGTQRPVVAAVPVVYDGRVQAMAQVSLEPVPIPRRLPWLRLVGIGIGAVVLLVLLGALAPSVSRGAAVGLAALAVLASLKVVQGGHRHELLLAVEQRAQIAASLAEALAGSGAAAPPLEAPAAGAEPPAAAAAPLLTLGPDLLAAINVTEAGTRYADLLRVERLDGPALPLAEQYADADTATLGVRHRGWEVTVDRGLLRGLLDVYGRALRILGMVLFALVTLLYFFVALGFWDRVSASVHEHAFAYAYTVPAMVGMLVVVFIPFSYGIVMGFMELEYSAWRFVGVDHFVKILGSISFRDLAWFEPRNFYYTLAVTVMWTVLNVTLHVSIGLGLALLLHDKMLKMKAVYRVLLVVPWAVPNYITALIWQGMFHKEFGSINHYLGYLGVEPVSWFSSFWTAFAANLATNTWLGFPFMMVISLGALQSIPTDLYEAAEVDGASKWQQFRAITLPLLKPALFPAIILGTIWTFNQFNIIYLVSGGQPANSTDILIVEAFRRAFENRQYGYAAAYSTIIFLILLGYTLVTNRWARATAGAYE